MNKVVASSAMPMKKVHLPQAASLSQLATPTISSSMAIEPTKGHLLCCGTK